MAEKRPEMEYQGIGPRNNPCGHWRGYSMPHHHSGHVDTSLCYACRVDDLESQLKAVLETIKRRDEKVQEAEGELYKMQKQLHAERDDLREKLKAVLERESAAYKRYDDRLEQRFDEAIELERRLEQQDEEITQLTAERDAYESAATKALAERDRFLNEANAERERADENAETIRQVEQERDDANKLADTRLLAAECLGRQFNDMRQARDAATQQLAQVRENYEHLDRVNAETNDALNAVMKERDSLKAKCGGLVKAIKWNMPRGSVALEGPCWCGFDWWKAACDSYGHPTPDYKHQPSCLSMRQALAKAEGQ